VKNPLLKAAKRLFQRGSCFTAFSDDLHNFLRGNIEADAFNIQRGIHAKLRPYDENPAVFSG
jgi:hypothetical protein